MGGQAFTGRRLNGFFMDPEDFVVIGLDTSDGPEHPLFDPRVLDPPDEELGRDIMVFGVHTPVKVRKNGNAAEVVFGRDRIKAARWANGQLRKAMREPIEVPFLIFRASDEADYLGIAISENEHRRPDDVMTKAAKAARLHALGKTEAEVAARFGVTPQTVKAWLAILDTSAKVRTAVATGKVSATAAAKLARAEQDTALAEMMEAGNTTVAAANGRTRRGNGRAPSVVPGRATLRSLVEEGKETLPDDVMRVLKWVTGAGRPTREISALLRKINPS